MNKQETKELNERVIKEMNGLKELFKGKSQDFIAGFNAGITWEELRKRG